jgi:phosphoglycolate phosphatase-like HAD superfamily hydrolase
MIYIFDLDGTLCETKEGDYGSAVPMVDRIEAVNRLGSEGHTIFISTARSAHWTDLTRRQLLEWGVRHHGFSVGDKPFGHIYVDDRAINARHFFMEDEEPWK